MTHPSAKLVIFDFYGVIARGSYRDTAKMLARKYERNWRDVYAVLYHKHFNDAAEGKINERQLFIRALRELGMAEDWRVVRAKHEAFFHLNRPMVALARKLQRQGYLVVMLSKNTPRQFRAVMKKLGVRQWFRYVINTYDLKLPKASPRTIRALMRQFRATPAETIVVDDQDFNLTAPRALGVRTVLYRNDRQAKRAVEKLLP